jgi:hypothetical protein
MTPAQQIALGHPCYLAGETAHPRFSQRSAGGVGPMSLVLTVNAGYE